MFLAFTASPEDHSKELQRLGFVTAELARAGAAVIASPIAPRKASRDAIRETVIHTAGAGGNFFTIHVATPLEHCEVTDRKGVYQRARSGQLAGVAGVDVVYEAPERPDLTVDVTTQSIPEIVHSTCFRVTLYRVMTDSVFRRYCLAPRDKLVTLVQRIRLPVPLGP